MKCPSCNSGLNQHSYHGVAVDICRKCGGIWFDSGEMKEYVEYLLEVRDDIPDSKIELNKKVSAIHDGSPGISRPCPRCAQPMQVFNYAYDSNIMLDKCQACNGIWTDGREVRKLAVYIKGNPKLEAMGKSMAVDREKTQALNDFFYSSRMFMRGGGLSWLLIPKIILPLEDDKETNRFPGAVVIIFLINLCAFIGELHHVQDASLFFRKYGLVPAVLFSGGGYVSVITSFFLHGGWLHFLSNMFVFMIFGDNVEDALGHIRFVIFYLLLGICTGLFQALVHFRSELPAVGASGAIAGIMGAYFVLYPQARIKTWFMYWVFDMPAYLVLGMWIFVQIVYLALHTYLRVPTTVGWVAHIGGFLCGMLFIWLYKIFRII